MLSKPILKNRSEVILILAVFGVVITLFSGYHALSGLGQNTISHQSDAFSCLFTICVAILNLPTLLTLLLVTTAILNPVFPPKFDRFFILYKPPRRQAFT